MPEDRVPKGGVRERVSSPPSSQDTNRHPGDCSRVCTLSGQCQTNRNLRRTCHISLIKCIRLCYEYEQSLHKLHRDLTTPSIPDRVQNARFFRWSSPPIPAQMHDPLSQGEGGSEADDESTSGRGGRGVRTSRTKVWLTWPTST